MTKPSQGEISHQTRTFVIHPDIATATSQRDAARALDEAVALSFALPGLEIVDAQVVSLKAARAGYLFGSGKIDELAQVIRSTKIELVLINGPVTPVQQRNLEREWNVKILDRTGLILEIFSDRARTREGVLQVEMAALSYQRTRLVRAWTHLERQRGGLGFVGGPGETQIEADRRAIDQQLTRLKRQLGKVQKTRGLHRSARAKVPYPIVALVGYTNAGKSTLFNRLTGSEVVAKDMLFATLDPTMRSVRLDDGPEVIFSDTVGFISELPTQLVAAFRATLEEVLSADLILHVRDISHPETELQATDVREILEGLGVATETPLFEFWNKIDLLDVADVAVIKNQALRRPKTFVGAAIDGSGLPELLAAIATKLSDPRIRAKVRIRPDEGRKRAWLYEARVVENEVQDEEGVDLTVRWTERQKAAFERL